MGEGIDDLRDFNAHEFAAALVGTFDERFDADEDGLRGENAKEAAVTAGERRRDVLEGAPVAAESEAAQEAGAEPELAEEAELAEAALAADEPVLDAQGDVEEAFAEAAEEALAEPADADLLDAALGHRTHETIVVEAEEDTPAGLEAAELADLDRNAEVAAEAAESEKKGFWKRWF